MMTRAEILTNVFTQLREAGYVYNKTDFAHHLRYDPTYISSRLTGNREVSNKTLTRILKVFPQVNRDYLFTGKGEVLNTNTGPRLMGMNDRQEDVKGSPLLETLIAERDVLLERLLRINQVIETYNPSFKRAS